LCKYRKIKKPRNDKLRASAAFIRDDQHAKMLTDCVRKTHALI